MAIDAYGYESISIPEMPFAFLLLTSTLVFLRNLMQCARVANFNPAEEGTTIINRSDAICFKN
jgi:hypothetical protein